MSSTMSILGLYNYDATIFDNMKLPTQVDKETLIGNILSECAEVEILYSDPEYIKYAIGLWSSKELATWQRLADTFELEYNPLYNVDATEYTKETRDLHGTETGSNVSASSGSNKNTHKVAGYNTENVLTASESDEGENSENGTLNTDINRSDTGDIITEHRRYGNIGVTKSTELLQSELDTRPKLNIYNYIIDSFKSRFCLMIY